MQLGIRLHDVNTGMAPEHQTIEARAAKAKEEGFACVHLAYSKVIKGVTFDETALTEGLGAYTKRVLSDAGLDVAVLGCYLNLAHPDPVKLAEIQSRYYGHIRVAAQLGASVVGTETGAPNAGYVTDANTHSAEALQTFIRGLEPVVECAENYGVTLAIEPVWKHIVYDAGRAKQVIRSIGSRNLRIIFDPVNLLGSENLDEREKIISRTMDTLCEHIAVVHLKDYRLSAGDLVSIPAGTGGMDYREILAFMKARKPYIQATLENTTNESAVSTARFIRELYDSI